MTKKAETLNERIALVREPFDKAETEHTARVERERDSERYVVHLEFDPFTEEETPGLDYVYGPLRPDAEGGTTGEVGVRFQVGYDPHSLPYQTALRRARFEAHVNGRRIRCAMTHLPEWHRQQAEHARASRDQIIAYLTADAESC